MARNYMKEVANLLGVELGEEFKIKGYEEYVYRFGVDYLFAKADGRNEWFETNLLEDLLNGSLEIEKTILTEKEKEYLSAVIKPFKDIMQSIRKEQVCGVINSYYCLVFDTLDCEFALPCFELNEHYVGMELDKEYSLEELGL